MLSIILTNLAKLADGVYPKGIYGTEKFPNELLNDLSIPYAIMLSDGKVVWINNSFSEL